MMKSHSESKHAYELWLKNSIGLFKNPIPQKINDHAKDYKFANAKNKIIFDKLTAIEDSKFGLSKTSKMDDIVKVVLNDLLSMDSFDSGSAELSLRIKICITEVIQIRENIKEIEFKAKLQPSWFYDLLQKPTAEKKLTEVIQKLDERMSASTKIN